MPRTALALLLLTFVVLALPAAAATEEIPFQFTDGFICVEARVDDSGEPLTFLLDSGAGASVLSVRTARRLNLKFGRTESIRGVGSEAVSYRLESLRTRAGAVTLPPIPLAVDLSMADELCSRPIDGLIGVDFFKGRVVQIDYVRRCLRLLDATPEMTSASRLPITMRNGIMCVPVGVNESAARWTRLDTGCNDALHWVVPRPNERAKRLGVSIGFVSDANDTSLTSVSLAGNALSNIKTTLHGRALFEGEAGLLGNGLLSRFLVTVDWPRRQVLLSEPAR